MSELELWAKPAVVVGSEVRVIDFYLPAVPFVLSRDHVAVARQGSLQLFDGLPETWVAFVLAAWARLKAGDDVADLATHRLDVSGVWKDDGARIVPL